MDSVIAKLDTSVFGMLTDQEPRIMIDGVSSPEEIELVNRLKPDFIRFEGGLQPDHEASSCIAAPGIRILTSVDDIPLYSSALDKRTLSLDTKADASDLPAMMRRRMHKTKNGLQLGRPFLLICKTPWFICQGSRQADQNTSCRMS